MRVAVLSTVFSVVAPFVVECGSTAQTRGVTVAQVRALESFESLLPEGTDSVVELYRQYDPGRFYTTHQDLPSMQAVSSTR